MVVVAVVVVGAVVANRVDGAVVDHDTPRGDRAETRRRARWAVEPDRERRRRTVGQNQVILSHPIIHCPTSEGVSGVSGASEPANAAEGASEATSPE